MFATKILTIDNLFLCFYAVFMNNSSFKLLSVAEAAERLGVTRVRVNQLIDAGALPAQRIGRAYAIMETDLAEFEKRDRQAGRPPKTKPKTNDE